MAKANNVNQIIAYGAVGTFGYLVYNMALDCQLGDNAYRAAAQIHNALKIGGGQLPDQLDTNVPNGHCKAELAKKSSSGDGTPSKKGNCSIAATGSLALMKVDNPNIDKQISEWQAARKANGENAYDWAAFAVHAQAISGSDPGGSPPPEFCA